MGARQTAFRLCLCLLALTLAACGGGGGGGAASTLPPAGPVQTPGGSAPAPAVPVDFTIAIPAVSPSSSLRRVRYVSAGTKSVVVTFGTQRQVADCTTTCSMTLLVAPGNVAFSVGLFSAPAGAGSLLSTGQTTATIVTGSQNIVKITFSGVVASVAIALGTAVVVAGSPATIPLYVTARDAAGYAIIGPDMYQTPIALGSDDTSGATALSTTALASPSATATLAYNGAANLSAARISASVPGTGISSSAATLSVQQPPPPPPAGSVPKHVATWYYIDDDNINMKLPAKFMADHATYVEGTLDSATAFKAAGGKYVAGYLDAAYAGFCAPPFMPPVPQSACIGAVGKRITDESAFFHGASGARVHHYVAADNMYQEALNPASPAARQAYHDESVEIVQNEGGSADFIFADDIGGNFVGPAGTTASGDFSGFDAPGVEMTTDAQWLAALPGLFAASVRPQIINGVDSRTQLPAYNGALLDMPNVAGQAFEGCYADGDNVTGNRGDDRWRLQSNGLLATMQHRVIALCMMTAKPTPTNRIYEMASWWMTYTEPYSVAAPLTADANGITVVPEYEIVPRQPRASPTTDVAALRTPSGVYVREFAACYQAGVSIGPCATVVNPGASPVAMPALAGHYTSSLTVDDKDAYMGGTATWAGPVPAQLGPVGAVILR